jgi:hypothetical protein
MKVLISMEISQGYEHWKKVFVSHEEARSNAGIETIFYAREAANESKIHACMEVESMEVLGAFMSMPENAKIIEEAGHVPDSTVITPLVD